jgi:hypothetical protein
MDRETLECWSSMLALGVVDTHGSLDSCRGTVYNLRLRFFL